MYKVWDVKRQKRKTVVVSGYEEFTKAAKLLLWFSMSDFLRKGVFDTRIK